MTVDPAKTPHRHTHEGHDVLLLLGRLPRQIRRRSRKISATRRGRRGTGCAAGHDLYLPDASADPAGRPGHLPDLRHGAGAGERHRRSRPEPRTDRHDAPLLDRRAYWRCRSSSWKWAAFSGAHLRLIAPQVSIWIQFVLATPVVLWAGWPFFVRGWAVGAQRALNMFSLIALGVGAAYRLQPCRDLRARALSRELPRWTASSPVYFEAAAVITVLVLLGQVLELRAREQTGGAIRALLNLAPKTARRVPRRRQRRGSPAGASRMSAIACACGPATASRWMASSSRAEARSTSRW